MTKTKVVAKAGGMVSLALNGSVFLCAATLGLRAEMWAGLICAIVAVGVLVATRWMD